MPSIDREPGDSRVVEPAMGYRYAVAEDRRYEIEELLVRPGTYFNPQTEVLVVVDDSSSMDNEIFNLEEFEGADWVLISDEAPVDEPRRDELLEIFQATHHGGDGRQTPAMADPDAVDDDTDVEPEEDDRTVVDVEGDE
jgi:hypothetical protein